MAFWEDKDLIWIIGNIKITTDKFILINWKLTQRTIDRGQRTMKDDFSPLSLWKILNLMLAHGIK